MVETLMRFRAASQSGAARASGVPTPADFTAAAADLAATVVAVAPAVARPCAVGPLADGTGVPGCPVLLAGCPPVPVVAASGAVALRVFSAGAVPSVPVAGCCWLLSLLTDDVCRCWLL